MIKGSSEVKPNLLVVQYVSQLGNVCCYSLLENDYKLLITKLNVLLDTKDVLSVQLYKNQSLERNKLKNSTCDLRTNINHFGMITY